MATPLHPSPAPSEPPVQAKLWAVTGHAHAHTHPHIYPHSQPLPPHRVKRSGAAVRGQSQATKASRQVKGPGGPSPSSSRASSTWGRSTSSFTSSCARTHARPSAHPGMHALAAHCLFDHVTRGQSTALLKCYTRDLLLQGRKFSSCLVTQLGWTLKPLTRLTWITWMAENPTKSCSHRHHCQTARQSRPAKHGDSLKRSICLNFDSKYNARHCIVIYTTIYTARHLFYTARHCSRSSACWLVCVNCSVQICLSWLLTAKHHMHCNSDVNLEAQVERCQLLQNT